MLAFGMLAVRMFPVVGGHTDVGRAHRAIGLTHRGLARNGLLLAATAAVAALSAFPASLGCEATILRKAPFRRWNALAALACDFALLGRIH
jgi:hypothetical protein